MRTVLPSDAVLMPVPWGILRVALRFSSSRTYPSFSPICSRSKAGRIDSEVVISSLESVGDEPVGVNKVDIMDIREAKGNEELVLLTQGSVADKYFGLNTSITGVGNFERTMKMDLNISLR